jgi:plasmid stabilization system protein ParE
MRLAITRAAFNDLAGIWSYIAADSLDAADRVRDDLEAEMHKLADMPGMGHHRVDVPNRSYCFWKVHRYMIAYRVSGDTLCISRILHGSRDFRQAMGSRRADGLPGER